MKKVIIALIIMLLGINFSMAKTIKVPTRDFNSVIKASNVDRNSIAISIKDLRTGKVIYALNDKILMHPASVQKILTLIPAIEVLGDDYEFSTKIYKRENNSFIIKLGADPYLQTKDLKNLVKHITPDTKQIFIDDSIIETKDWGEGWQWDDDLNTLMPRFNAYNLDGNLIKITVMPTTKGQLATIINPSRYPLVFINNIKTDKINNIQITRDNSIASNILALNGTVNKPVVTKITINNLKRYFNIKLTKSLEDKNIYLKQNIVVDKINEQDKELDQITHPISFAVNDILKNSNNMISETVVKLAGGKAYNDIGTDIYGIKLFNDYCTKHKLDNSRIRLADASGVSKNNLVTTSFITDFLIVNKSNPTLQLMAAPGEGTLATRMIPLKNNIKAKTGTLSDISSIAGFLTSKTGNKYAFSIIIKDPSISISEMKTLEDYLLREAYLKL